MITTAVWIQQWVAITLSLSALIALATVLLCCVCWKKKVTSKFYIFDETEMKSSGMSYLTEYAQNSLNNLRLYRRLSGSKESKTENIFTSKNLPIFKVTDDVSEFELLESGDGLKSLESSTLKFEDAESQVTVKDELCSCISSESRNTFYSTHPTLARSNSRGTFVSVDFDSDTETLID